ncbi:MAG: hypothetical protein AVDCRST_MAG53-1779, partial [uncultured Solirubrobacteraceae bacterium]
AHAGGERPGPAGCRSVHPGHSGSHSSPPSLRSGSAAETARLAVGRGCADDLRCRQHARTVADGRQRDRAVQLLPRRTARDLLGHRRPPADDGGTRPARDRPVADLHLRLVNGHRSHVPRRTGRLRDQGVLRRRRRVGRGNHAAAVGSLHLRRAPHAPWRGDPPRRLRHRAPPMGRASRHLRGARLPRHPVRALQPAKRVRVLRHRGRDRDDVRDVRHPARVHLAGAGSVVPGPATRRV